MKREPYYFDVFRSGNKSCITYAPGSSIDTAVLAGIRGHVVAYRVKVTPKIAVTRVDIPGPSPAEVQARRYVNGLQGEEFLPPVSEQMLKAFGAFAMLFLVMAFAVWFMRDLFQ